MTDPDADLIEAMARAIDAKLKFSFKIWLSPMSAEAAACAALAVARPAILEEAEKRRHNRDEWYREMLLSFTYTLIKISVSGDEASKELAIKTLGFIPEVIEHVPPPA